MMHRIKTDEEVRRHEQAIGLVLIIGVIAAASIVLGRGLYYLIEYGSSRTDFSVFRGGTSTLRSLPQTFVALRSASSRIVIQAGLFVLVLLQSVRLLFCAWLFARQVDWCYVLMSLFLIGVLLHSFV
jgi:uncharacterized membrane protein